MSDAGSESAAAAFCAELVRNHDFDRYAATLFVDPASRRALLALYAFNVEIVRVREQVSLPLPGELRLQWWSDMLAGTSHGGVEGNPVAVELQRAIKSHALPVAPLARLIEAHLFDLYNDPMPSLTALETHLDDTVATLFALAAQILGQRSPLIDHAARHAGLAQGIAQVIANLPFDSARRQLFVPLQVLQSHGSGEAEAYAGTETPTLRTALNELCGTAQTHLDAALTLLADIPAAARPAFLPLALVRRDLARLGRADTKLFAPYQRSRLATLWTLWRGSRSRVFR
ncbi:MULTISPECIES: phytoene/squalene synthase family protein [Rhodopseudomonas]|uniref:Phytoene synthase n=1 Tax=Rhodopseudomonas palustris TaxID=1076 RepID=A0A0D7ETC0_RHOPL|nr:MULTISPECIES: phytoene/squalene synthase family protein [Rhodopseudomonas]KIZ44043.1 phytoene synthase [Rhodopseudomonas palustris]MDF3809304.1 phytoene/squalene synthase family protein [Rhodopseudomonas sp. BAL398]WOK19014.1 phytoene/squalene synthase family protein [Rhodopseudomonas sp. BAL398]